MDNGSMMNYGVSSSNWGMQNAHNNGNLNNYQGMNMGFNGGNNMPRTATKPLIPGRAIRQLSEMSPYDVPNDGTPAFFPVINDQGQIDTIIVKYWDNVNIEIRTDTYVRTSSEGSKPVAQQNMPIPNRNIFEDILNRLDQIEGRMNDISRSDQQVSYTAKESESAVTAAYKQ